uniref:Uncharacterized protein n=1 Tax=Rhizophora mucronata TaxID=61149 RepID=A0A2P2PTP5_RHIMU
MSQPISFLTHSETYSSPHPWNYNWSFSLKSPQF